MTMKAVSCIPAKIQGRAAQIGKHGKNQETLPLGYESSAIVGKHSNSSERCACSESGISRKVLAGGVYLSCTCTPLLHKPPVV
jgi:hypothetical protein